MDKYTFLKKGRQYIMKNSNESMKKENLHLKEELNAITKKKQNSSTTETKFDKHGSKGSMYEPVK